MLLLTERLGFRLRLVNDPSIDSILALMIITLGGTMRHIVGFETLSPENLR